MDRDEILNKLRKANEIIGQNDVPEQKLYELLKVYEDSLAFRLSEGRLMEYIGRRMSLSRDFQLEVRQMVWKAEVPSKLYEFLKGYEDSVAEELLVREGALLMYTDARMDVAEDFQD